MGPAPSALRSLHRRAPDRGRCCRHPAACWARSLRRTAWAGGPGTRLHANTSCAPGWTAWSRCPPMNVHCWHRAAAAGRPPAAGRRWRPRPARPPGRSAGAHTVRRIRSSAAAPRRRPCRRPTRTCRTPIRRRTPPAHCVEWRHRHSSGCARAHRGPRCSRWLRQHMTTRQRGCWTSQHSCIRWADRAWCARAAIVAGAE